MKIFMYKFMNYSNIPGLAKKRILNTLVKLLQTSSTTSRNANIKDTLKQRKTDKIRKEVRVNQAVLHDKSNLSFNRVRQLLDSNWLISVPIESQYYIYSSHIIFRFL